MSPSDDRGPRGCNFYGATSRIKSTTYPCDRGTFRQVLGICNICKQSTKPILGYGSTSSRNDLLGNFVVETACSNDKSRVSLYMELRVSSLSKVPVWRSCRISSIAVPYSTTSVIVVPMHDVTQHHETNLTGTSFGLHRTTYISSCFACHSFS